MSVILGIDPGSNVSGFGVIDAIGNQYNYITSGSIRTTKNHLGKQLNEIFRGVYKLVKLYQPEEVAIEQVFMHANVNSALKLGQARGAAIVAIAGENIKIAEYSARQVKQAVVGYGNAEKSQVQHMVKLLLKIKSNLMADEADALAVAICHANSRNTGVIRGISKYSRCK